MARVGVLALQGGFAAHAGALTAAGHTPVLVRTAEDLAGLAGLILPGGESTTQLRLLSDGPLAAALDAFVRAGHPLLATCAGLILSAREVTSPAQESFRWLDVAVARNAWGRQLDSFEATDDAGSRPLVFIRAPRITAVGPSVTALATYRGEPILIRQGNRWGATFHPELTDSSLHARVF